jgi:putative ABC transport system permease protein
VASWLTFRSLLRTRWAVWLGLALLVGATAGAVMAGVAGARRTATAHNRFVERQHGVDVLIAVQCPGTFGDPGCVDNIARVPSVAAVTVVELFDAYITANGKSVQPDPNDACYSDTGRVDLIGDRSGRFGTEINDIRIVAGRRADPAAPDEVVLSKAVADRLGLGPGSTLRASLFRPGQCEQPDTWRAPVSLHVVGIGVAPGEVPPPSGNYFAFVHVTPAFVAAQPPRSSGPLLPVRLSPGADSAALRADLERVGVRVEAMIDVRDLGEPVARGIRPHAVALAVGAALFALAGAFVLGQTLLRQSESDAADGLTLAALGMSRRQQLACAMLPAGFLAVVAGVTAGVLAVALSPLTPVGPARALDPDPGLSGDAVVLTVGVAATVLFVIAIAAVAAWRRSRHNTAPNAATPQRSAVVGAIANTGLPPTVVSGMRMAVNRGRGTVPVLTSVSALTIAVFTVVGALTFGAGLDHLLDTPRLRGVNWDLYLFSPMTTGPDGQQEPIERSRVEAVLADARGVESFAAGVYWPPFPEGRDLELGPQRLQARVLGFSGSGGVGPSIVRGRVPDTSAEVLLGPETLADLELDIGDTVDLHGQAGTSDEPGEETHLVARIVGVGLVPDASGEGRLGRGAVMTIEGIQQLNPDAVSDGYWLRLAEGADASTTVAGLLDAVGAVQVGEEFPFYPQAAFEAVVDVRDLEPLDRVPMTFAVAMGVMAVGVIAHVLVNALRANRRDLAVMRALGFRRGDVQRAVAWQSIIYAVVALAVGVPLGVIAGRFAWRSYSNRLGAVPEPVVSWAPLGIVIAGVLVIAVLCGLAVSWRRAAASPAAALRSE